MAPDTPRLARDRADVRVMTEIGIISQLSNARLEKTGGIPAAQFGLLSHFMRRGGEQSPAQLAAAFQVGKSAMTHTLQRAEGAGWISIRPDAEDGRRKLVSLTPAGAAAYGEALKRMRPHLESLREAFTDQEFEQALPFLTALRIWFDDNR
ncbi:MAG: MarR family winged helix-turn-helix transcriptional regulator [Caulobacter sp.]|nr:MarR family winged helix-turn-helix transcriptional regulator [Caulobacter sp.]